MRAMKRTVSVLLALMLVLGMATMGISVAGAATATNKVTYTSNIGASGSVDYIPGTTEQVTVTYDLTTTYGIVNLQGKVYFDPTVLKVANSDVLPNLTDLTTSINTGLTDHVTITASGFNPADFSTKKTLVKVVFDVIGSGDTTVNLVVDYMTGNTGASSTTAATDVDLVTDGTADSTKMTTAAEAAVNPAIEEDLVDPSTFLYMYGSYLAGEVSLQTYFRKAPKGYDPSTLSVKFSGPEQMTAENVTIPYTELTTMTNTISYHNYRLYSGMLNDDVTWEVIQNGKTIAKDTYSIEKYVVDKLPTTTNPAQVNLFKALLNFGAKAQEQFNYNTENPADARIDYTAPTVTADDIVLPAEITGTHPSTSTLGFNKLLEGGEYLAATNLMFVYKITNATKYNAVQFTVDGEEVAPTVSGSNATLKVEGIPSAKLDSVYTIGYNDMTYKTSVLAQVKKSLTSNPNNKFYQAVYLYNQAANEFFGQ